MLFIWMPAFKCAQQVVLRLFEGDSPISIRVIPARTLRRLCRNCCRRGILPCRLTLSGIPGVRPMPRSSLSSAACRNSNCVPRAPGAAGELPSRPQPGGCATSWGEEEKQKSAEKATRAGKSPKATQDRQGPTVYPGYRCRRRQSRRGGSLMPPVCESGLPEIPFHCGTLAIVGRPDVRELTLLNCMVGMKISITSKKPQTAGHRVTGILTTAQAQFIFVDTPGFQTRHGGALNRAMNRSVSQALAEVDVSSCAFLRLAVAAPRIAPFLPAASGAPGLAAHQQD